MLGSSILEILEWQSRLVTCRIVSIYSVMSGLVCFDTLRLRLLSLYLGQLSRLCSSQLIGAYQAMKVGSGDILLTTITLQIRGKQGQYILACTELVMRIGESDSGHSHNRKTRKVDNVTRLCRRFGTILSSIVQLDIRKGRSDEQFGD